MEPRIGCGEQLSALVAIIFVALGVLWLSGGKWWLAVAAGVVTLVLAFLAVIFWPSGKQER